jgi:hypothetical protein
MKLKQDKNRRILLGKTKHKKPKKNNRFLSSKLNMMCNIKIPIRREKIKTNDTTNEFKINFGEERE